MPKPVGVGLDTTLNMAERIGADPAAVAVEVARRVVEIACAERGELGVEPGAQPYRSAAGSRERALARRGRARPSGRCRVGMLETVGLRASAIRVAVRRKIPGDDGALRLRDVDTQRVLQRKTDEDRVPLRRRPAGTFRVERSPAGRGAALPGDRGRVRVARAGRATRSRRVASLGRSRQRHCRARRVCVTAGRGRPSTSRRRTSNRSSSEIASDSPAGTVQVPLPVSSRVSGSIRIWMSARTGTASGAACAHGTISQQSSNAKVSPRVITDRCSREFCDELERARAALDLERQPGAGRLAHDGGCDFDGLLRRTPAISMIRSPLRSPVRSAIDPAVTPPIRTPFSAGSSVMPSRGRATGASRGGSATPNTASARPGTNVAQSPSRSQGSSDNGASRPICCSWWDTPQPWITWPLPISPTTTAPDSGARRPRCPAPWRGPRRAATRRSAGTRHPAARVQRPVACLAAGDPASSRGACPRTPRSPMPAR